MTGIKPFTLRKFVEIHKEYCTQIPNTQLFGINNFGTFKGNVAEMVKHYQNKLEQENKNQPDYNYFSSLVII
ncbi:hypothetical protein DXX94_02375 [Thalassotalea euphylliae]|uniref:Uncharacterized protein n=2 Tax=Thalassotalea euphylliae TaxID=1655234 RepID=A0A3E0U0S4_9GAMM|nr:hypothetical protein DXX94_02375 [Thalassotalea euphylliae]